jgi:hypothetical protein
MITANELMQKVAEIAPQKYEFIVKAASEIRASPFKDEVVSELDGLISKAASIGSTAANVGSSVWGAVEKPVKYMGAAIAGSVAMMLAGDMYDATRRGLTKSRNYKAMLEANPDLAEQAATDPSIKSHFNTLHRLNPEYSSDPNIAATYVRVGNSYGGDLAIVNSLVSARKNLRDSKSLPMMPKIPWSSAAEDELNKAQLDKTKAEGFRARQQGHSEYNKRMGMYTPEQAKQMAAHANQKAKQRR